MQIMPIDWNSPIKCLELEEFNTKTTDSNPGVGEYGPINNGYFVIIPVFYMIASIALCCWYLNRREENQRRTQIAPEVVTVETERELAVQGVNFETEADLMGG
jgi:hypothetical protein